MPEVEPRFKSAKKKPKVPTKTQQLKRCDTLFSVLIRSAGRCARCGSQAFLQCAHVHSRRYRAVRFDERNAVAQCRACHTYFTHRPLEKEDWERSYLGDALFEELRRLALTGPNPDLSETYERLRERIERLGKAS